MPDARFIQNFPDEARAPSERTELYLVYDDRALYVGIRCHDRQPAGIVEWLTRRDRETAADRVTVDIDSRHDHGSAYHFDVNVSGVLADGLRFNDVDYNVEWDGLWNAATSRDRGGWTAELEIPWRTLRFDGRAPVMGLQVRRYIPRRQEVDEWAFVPRSERGEVSRYGSLAGVAGLGPKRLMQILPYVAGAVLVRSRSASPSDDGAQVIPNGGFDAKLGLTSSLTLDASFNPDFGQVEADQAVLNLTTFEVFFPEKRPFFLEGVELFATPIQQFYSRRIGRSPSTFNAAASDVLVDTPLTGRIWGAVKLSGQIVPHLSIAALDALTAEETVLVRPGGGPAVERRLLDPLANFAVLRLRGEWRSSYVGAMVTAVNRFEADAAAAPHPGDSCPGDEDYVSSAGRCTHDAYTASVDTRVATADGKWGMSAQGIASLIERGRSRLLADGTVVGSGATGFGVKFAGGKLGGEPLGFEVRYEGYTSTLDLNDAGYLRSANLHYLGGNFTVRTTRRWGATLESNWDSFGWNRFSWSGVLVEQGFGTGPWVRFRNFWQLWFGGGWYFDRWDNRETHDGALTRRRGGFWVEAWLKSDPRRALTGELNLHANRVQHGYNTNGDLTVGLRPLPQLELQVIPRFSYTSGDVRFAAVAADGSRYWFGDLESRSFDVTLRGIYTFMPRLTLQLYAQVFLAGAHFASWVAADVGAPASCAGASNPCPRAQLPLESFVAAGPPPDGALGYDLQSGQININVVMRWEYLPGSALLAVYTRSQSQPDFDPSVGMGGAPSLARFRAGPAVDQVLVKLSYLWR